VSAGSAGPPPVDPARDHLRGDGPRTLLLYGDYECPHSLRAYRIAQALQADGAAFALCFRHLPNAEAHPHALQAAVAAEAAHDQGRFWDMHDALFAAQQALGRADLRAKAAAIGLDTERFEREFAADAHLERITADVRGALEAGAARTPSLFAGGAALGSYAPEALRAALGV
jgi:Na+:H+ antiporter, NhaA family